MDNFYTLETYSPIFQRIILMLCWFQNITLNINNKTIIDVFYIYLYDANSFTSESVDVL